MNPQAMMAQFQKMQQALTKKLTEFANTSFEYKFNDYVTIKINGSLTIEELTINSEIVDKDDIDTLQDVIASSINKAIKSTLDKKEEIMSSMTPNGLGSLGGLL